MPSHDSAPKPRRKARADEENVRWLEILATAEKFFVSKGYHATRTEDIARELGILKGSLYHYIDSKEDLLYHTLRGITLDCEAHLLSHLPAGGDPAERLLRALELEMDYVARNRERISMFMREYNALTGPRLRRLVTEIQRFEGHFVEMIRAGQAQGRFLDADPVALMQGMLGMCIFTHHWYAPGTEKGANPGDIKKIFLQLLSKGFMAPAVRY